MQRTPIQRSTPPPKEEPPVAAVAEKINAMLVIHGMGEQVRFETLDDLVEGLRRAGAIEEKDKVVARTILGADGEPTQRLELTIRKGKDTRKLHLYEAYWAPVTEGEVKVTDTIWFLISGGWNGIRRAISQGRWWRWMFEHDQEFEIPQSTPLQLIVALTTVIGLTIMNLVALVVAGLSIPAFNFGRTNRPLLMDLSTTLGFVALQATFLLLLLIVAGMLRAAPLWARRAAAAIAFGAFYASLTAIAAGIFLVPLEVAFHAARNVLRETARQTDSLIAFSVSWIVITLILAAITWRVGRPSRVLRGLLSMAVLISIVPILVVLLHIVVSLINGYEKIAPCHSLWIFLWVQGPPHHHWLGWATTPWMLLVWVISIVLLTVYRHDKSPVRYTSSVLSCISTLALTYRIAFWIGSKSPPKGAGCDARGMFNDTVALVLPWFGVLVISSFVKWFLSQYLGDVAAYVSSNRLDRFSKIRKEIQDIAMKAATTIFTAEPKYDSVGVVGHSLGSVIAYDTVNRIMNDDGLRDGVLKVVDRTTLLLTFGSPLDKTAYVFSTSPGKDDPTRDSLAASVQPLILDKKYREKLRWINVWTPNDIISDRLKFYDAPGVRAVENHEDEDASVPLTAHTAYWQNSMVFNFIVEWAVS
ncbi:MAG TPA: hypothetical protein VER58_10255 [Thermoanaerobaculia bacterium]|nr:hypothetical protein [Thermoanaerobaculia bacterium]